MTNSRTTVTGTLLGALLTVTLLAGCNPGAEASATTPDVTNTPVATQTAEPEPEPTVAPPVVGETITEAQAQDLPDGMKGFVLPDNNRVVVAADQPLPPAVVAVAQAEMAARIASPGTSENPNMNRAEIVDAAQYYASLLGLQTGKRIVIIYPMVGSCSMAQDAYFGWSNTSVTGHDPKSCFVLPTLDEVQERVTGLIAQSEDPYQYEVLVLER